MLAHQGKLVKIGDTYLPMSSLNAQDLEDIRDIKELEEIARIRSS